MSLTIRSGKPAIGWCSTRPARGLSNLGGAFGNQGGMATPNRYQQNYAQLGGGQQSPLLQGAAPRPGDTENANVGLPSGNGRLSYEELEKRRQERAGAREAAKKA